MSHAADQFLSKIKAMGPCIVPTGPNRDGKEIVCDVCEAPIGQRCRTKAGKPTRFHALRRQIHGHPDAHLERGKWRARAAKGEVEPCGCFVCYGPGINVIGRQLP